MWGSYNYGFKNAFLSKACGRMVPHHSRCSNYVPQADTSKEGVLGGGEIVSHNSRRSSAVGTMSMHYLITVTVFVCYMIDGVDAHAHLCNMTLLGSC